MALTKITSTNIGANAVTTSAVNLTAPLAFANSTANVISMSSNGFILVGGTSTVDGNKFQIFGAKTLSGGITQNQLNIADTTTMAAGVGGSIGFSAIYDGTSYTTMGSIEGVRENATSGNYAGALVFKSRQNGGNNLERMRIDSSGQVTKPYQAGFMVSNLDTSTFNSGSGAAAFMKGGTVQFDTTSGYNSTTGRYTIPVSGRYMFNAAVLVNTGSGRLEFSIRINGVDAGLSGNGTGTTYDAPTLNVILQVSAGDYITITRGSGTAYGAHGNQYFNGFLLG